MVDVLLLYANCAFGQHFNAYYQLVCMTSYKEVKHWDDASHWASWIQIKATFNTVLGGQSGHFGQ